MSTKCESIAELARIRFAAVEHEGRTVVDAEFTNNHAEPLWVPQEPVPAYRVDSEKHSVLLTYGYFEDVYGSYRGQYMMPAMKKVNPGERLRWRIDDKQLLEKLLAPNTPSALRMRVALREFPQTNVRGAQPLDEYLNASCTLRSSVTVLRR